MKGEFVESVSCRWCGRDDAIEVVDRNEAALADDPTTQSPSN
ncbi:hypothetical protein [Nocardioides sp. B-3]|nr:hypothetical protein [Nocardioides sp. B-3]